MQYKKFLFPEQHKTIPWLKITWKWFKIVLGTFLLMSTVWGCGQMIGDTNIGSSTITSAYDFKEHNVAAVFFEFLIGSNNIVKNHLFHIGGDGNIYEYGFTGIRTWGEAWTKTKSPFFGLFVYPIAWLLVNISAGLSGSSWNPNHPNAVAIIFAIIFTTIIIKLITLVFSFKAQQSSERMQAVQMKTSAIQAKYKHSRDHNAKQKMQMELMAIYKKEGINPMAAFIPIILSMPFLFSLFQVMKLTNVLKNTSVGYIRLVETPWSMIGQGHFAYLIVVVIYLPIQVISMLLPLFLNRARQKVKTKEAKAAFKKQLIMNSIFMFLYIFFVFSAPAGLVIYWIISSLLQILQIIGFHYYNKHKRNLYKKKGTLAEPFLTKVKKLFIKPPTIKVVKNKEIKSLKN